MVQVSKAIVTMALFLGQTLCLGRHSFVVVVVGTKLMRNTSTVVAAATTERATLINENLSSPSSPTCTEHVQCFTLIQIH